jgi:hypothetical protein
VDNRSALLLTPHVLTSRPTYKWGVSYKVGRHEESER